MSDRTYTGPPLDCREQWIGERPYRGSGETVGGSSADDTETGEEKTVGLPDFAVTRAARTSELSEDVETSLRTIEAEVTRAHRDRETLEDARAVVRFARRVCTDDELLQVIGQLERVLELEPGADE